MIDIKLLRTNIQKIATELNKKNFTLDTELFLALDKLRKERQIITESLQAQRNNYAKTVGKLIQSAKIKGESVEELTSRGDVLKKNLAESENLMVEIQNEIQEMLETIPNIPDRTVPLGNDESSNLEISRYGKVPNLMFEPADHSYLGAKLSGIDFDRAAKITGARFTFLSGAIAQLHRALSNYMLSVHTVEHNYEEVYVPFIVNRQSLFGTGQIPKFEEDLFKLEDSREFYLIPTAEVPVTNIFRGEIIQELPIKMVSHTPCFRSEAGSHGKDTKGMIRQHQFDKVELVQFVEPQNSWSALEELTHHAKTILQRLELPHRCVMLCGGDLGFASAKTYDLEVWIPSQNTYREISSCSNFTDFQARRMKTRYRNINTGSLDLVHTVNGSGLAIGRTLVAILENYQSKDGTITIPEVLRPFMNGLEKIR
tara:strand:- start:5254 stop:6534 length:1281 start_codon:yes stop_codon:yes gene_type:complete